jgi:hypothetical protein
MRGQRRITVNYAKRQQGRKMVGGQSSYLPLKINMPPDSSSRGHKKHLQNRDCMVS